MPMTAMPMTRRFAASAPFTRPAAPAPATVRLRHSGGASSLAIFAVFATVSLGATMALATWPAAPAWAQTDLHEATARYNRSPSATLAMEVAQDQRKRGNVSSAANWAERALVAPDRDNAHQRAEAMLRDLRWPLRDANIGRVEILAQPPTASIAVDDVPLLPKRARYRVWLRSGSHQLVASMSGYSGEDRIIDAKSGEERTVTVRLTDVRPASIEVEVLPVTAEIWIDGVYVGLSTRRSFSVRAGKRMIEIRADGFESWTDAFDLEPNQQRVVSVTLGRAGAMRRGRPAASNVDRPLSPLELANRGERHELGHRPHDRLRSRTNKPVVSGSADDAHPKGDADADGNGPTPPRTSQPDRFERDDPGTNAPDANDGAGDGEGNSDAAPSGPASSKLKGLLWASMGVLLVGGGVATAVLGVEQAQTANSMRVGDAGYSAAYSKGETLTYTGYGIAGAGAIAIGVGGAYLLSRDGLSRTGRGLLLIGLGAAASGAGGWLMLTSVQVGEEANKLQLRDKRYDAAFDSALGTWRIGAVSAGVGALGILSGIWTLLGSDGDGQQAQLLPTFAPGFAGASLHASF